MATLHATTVQALQSNKLSLLTTWIESLEASGATRNVKEADLKQQANDFLNTLIAALEQGGSQNVNQENWAETRVLLEKLSHSRALVGQDSQQTASFIFALKGPLFALLQREYAEQPAQLAEQLWEISELLDALGMHTIRTFQKSRELVIKRQQEELLELSTPCLLYTSPSPRDQRGSRMPSSA